MKLQAPSSLQKTLEAVICLWLVGCVAGFVFVSRHWPMVGDVTYMHYVVFLMHHGMQPYRDIVDMNLPGSYMLEGSAMALLGPGASGWRLYDMLVACSRFDLHPVDPAPSGRLAGIFAASLFILVHAQDGVIMSGERDFAASLFLFAAVALLSEGVSGRHKQRLADKFVFCSAHCLAPP